MLVPVDPERAAIHDLVDYWTPLLLRVCVDAGVFGAFGREQRSVADVAAATSTHAPTLARMLRALASRGLFEPGEDGRYQLTSLGRRLVPDEPGSLAGLAGYLPFEIHAWAEVAFTLQSGMPSFAHVFGSDFWAYLTANPAAGAKFNQQMQQRTTSLLDAALPLLDWPKQGVVVDLGGGNGLLLSRVLVKEPQLRGILFDLAHVVAGSPDVLGPAGVAHRVHVVGGDLFSGQLPAGHDLYVLAGVLHDWDDDHARRILARCREVMPRRGRLVLLERVLPPGGEADIGKQVDLHMLVPFGEVRLLRHSDVTGRGGNDLSFEQLVPA